MSTCSPYIAPKLYFTHNEENKALFKYNPLTEQVCRKTEKAEGTQNLYRNDACVPFQEAHIRNLKAGAVRAPRPRLESTPRFSKISTWVKRKKCFFNLNPSCFASSLAPLTSRR